MLDRLFANTYDRIMAPAERAGLGEIRQGLVGDLRGDVLEIGAGTGLNLDHYPAQMASLTLTEPSEDRAVHLRRRAARLRPNTTVVVAPADGLPVEDDSMDTVVSTLVLCTVPDVPAVLAEVRRVLRPNGSFVLLEHVAARGGMRHVQRAINPAWKVVARGCHLTRDTRVLLEDAGFDTTGVVDANHPAFPVAKFGIRGIATPA